jgi:hypothetical protein
MTPLLKKVVKATATATAKAKAKATAKANAGILHYVQNDGVGGVESCGFGRGGWACGSGIQPVGLG